MIPECNIYLKKCNPVIPKGYFKCFKCNGVGCSIVSISFREKNLLIDSCPACEGSGYVDWIQHAKKHFEYKNRTHRLYINFKCHRPSCKVIKRWIKENRRKVMLKIGTEF